MTSEPLLVDVPYQGRRVQCVKCSPADLLTLTDWCDLVITGDYHFKRRHMENILSRGTSVTWGVLVEGVFSGLLILYRGSMLHNLYLSPEVRNMGLGAALLDYFKPAKVRAKTNMKAGDPVPFYEANGYHATGADPLKPHIVTMQRNDLPPAADNGEDASVRNSARTDVAPPAALTNGHTLKNGLTPEEDERRRTYNRERSRRLREKKKLLAQSQLAAAGGAPLQQPGGGGEAEQLDDQSWALPPQLLEEQQQQ